MPVADRTCNGLTQVAMICIAVHLNDRLICTAGIADASLLNVHLGSGIREDEPATYHVAGLCDLASDRKAHVYWVHETPLAVDDRLSFTMVESGEPTPSIEIKATDSPEYLKEQDQFEEFEKNWTGPDILPEVRWTALELKLKLKSEDVVLARILDEEEHILCSIGWNKWQPERCRVFVRSFSGIAQGEPGTETEWLRGVLEVGDSFAVSVHAESR